MEEFQSLLILMVVVWVMGKIFRMLSLPVIFGELLGGIIVGPLVLNLVSPESVTIKVLAELGIFFLMLHTGLETNPKDLFKASKKSILIALGGFLLPFGLGYLSSILLGLPINEALFVAMGVSMTAIAISVRLFKDYKIQGTGIANMILGAAVITDIIALVVFSIILSIVETGIVEFTSIVIMCAKILLFFAIVIVGGLKSAPYLDKVLHNKGFTFSLIVALGIGLFAELIGLHMIIGAFLAGLFIREEVLDEKIFNKIEDRIYGLSYSFLGPIFFTSLAFNLDFKAVGSNLGLLFAIVIVAILGKSIGAGVFAYIQKIKFRRAAIIGIIMNSRGAVDLIVASIAFEKELIGKEVFSILVIMAFITTLFAIFATKPLIKYAK